MIIGGWIVPVLGARPVDCRLEPTAGRRHRDAQSRVLHPQVFCGPGKDPDVPRLDIPGIDVVSLARGYGCTAERVTELEAFKAAVRRGLSGTTPLVIDVPISAEVPPLI